MNSCHRVPRSRVRPGAGVRTARVNDVSLSYAWVGHAELCAQRSPTFERVPGWFCFVSPFGRPGQPDYVHDIQMFLGFYRCLAVSSTVADSSYLDGRFIRHSFRLPNKDCIISRAAKIAALRCGERCEAFDRVFFSPLGAGASPMYIGRALRCLPIGHGTQACVVHTR